MATVKQPKVKQLQPRQHPLLSGERVVTAAGKGEAMTGRVAIKQLSEGREVAATRNALSTSIRKPRATALPAPQVTKSTASSTVNSKNVTKKADKPAASGPGAGKRVGGPLKAMKPQPTLQSSQLLVRHEASLTDRNIRRTDTKTVREMDLVESSTHRSQHLSDQWVKGDQAHKEEEKDSTAAAKLEEPEELAATQEYSDDFDDYESDFEEEGEEGVEGGGKVVETDETDHGPEEQETRDESPEIVKQENSLSEGNLIRDREAEESWQKERISISASAGIRITDPYVPETEDQQQLSYSSSRSRRQRDLSSVIKLNAMTYQIYNHPGISYDVYMRMFGRRNHRQLATQTNERQEESIQSEMFVTKDSCVQHPFYCYSAQQDKPFYHDSRVHTDPFRLLSFLTRCEKMLNILIKDSSTRTQTPNFIDSASTKSARRVMKLPAGSDKFCAQFHKLIGMSSLKKYPISLIRTESSTQAIASLQVDEERGESFILIWRTSTACRPEHVLHARSHVTCCCWTGDDRMVAGTRDGSLLMWEWRGSYAGNRVDVDSGNFVPREPAYGSSCIASLDVHHSRIVSIDCMDRQESEEGENPDQRCNRIVVVDEDAVISFWIVEVVVVKQSEMGEGMFPGSKCKLLLQASSKIDVSSTRVTFMCSAQDAAACFLLGMDSGLIYETSQYASTPITYAQIRDAETPLSPVSCVSLNPADKSLFLASFDDGTISMFSRTRSQSAGTHLMTWDSTDTHIASTVAVHWLPSCPTAFVCLSASSSLLFWDLHTIIWKPLFKYELTKVSCMSVTVEQDAAMAFGTEDGNIEIMTLAPQFRTRKDIIRVIKRLMNEEDIITHA